METLDFLRNVPAFTGLSMEALAALAARVLPTRYAHGDPLIRQDDASHALLILRRGAVRVTCRLSPDEPERLLAELSEGDVLGEMGLVSGSRRTATATARGEVDALELPLEAFRAMVDAHPSFALALARLLGDRLKRENTRPAVTAPGGRSCAVGIYLPKRSGRGDTGYIEQTLAFFGRLFGGATSTEAHGVWVSDVKGLVADELCIVRSFTTSIELERNLNAIVAYAGTMKRLLEQEAIALEAQGRLLVV